MIDIHHHLLFGLDDGAADIDISVAMAIMAAEHGTTHIVCTPHANSSWKFDPAVNEERATQLLDRLKGTPADQLVLGQGCDFHLSFENIQDALKNPRKYTLNGLGYLLVEFPDVSIPPNISDVFYELQLTGQTIILTHPERNPTIQRKPTMMHEWVRNGCVVQVTAGSLYGRFGRTAQALANELLDRDWIHVLASDAHNLTTRPPTLRQAYEYVTERKGEETARRLCITNPKAAFFGEEWPEQPTPEGLWDETPKFANVAGGSQAHSGKKKSSGFFGKLLGR